VTVVEVEEVVVVGGSVVVVVVLEPALVSGGRPIGYTCVSRTFTNRAASSSTPLLDREHVEAGSPQLLQLDPCGGDLASGRFLIVLSARPCSCDVSKADPLVRPRQWLLGDGTTTVFTRRGPVTSIGRWASEMTDMRGDIHVSVRSSR
jgi:hypothetical protein